MEKKEPINSENKKYSQNAIDLAQDIFIAILIIFSIAYLVPISKEIIGKSNEWIINTTLIVLFSRLFFQYSFLDLRKDITYLLLKIPYFYTIQDVEIEEVIEENE